MSTHTSYTNSCAYRRCVASTAWDADESHVYCQAAPQPHRAGALTRCPPPFSGHHRRPSKCCGLSPWGPHPLTGGLRRWPQSGAWLSPGVPGPVWRVTPVVPERVPPAGATDDHPGPCFPTTASVDRAATPVPGAPGGLPASSRARTRPHFVCG